MGEAWKTPDTEFESTLTFNSNLRVEFAKVDATPFNYGLSQEEIDHQCGSSEFEVAPQTIEDAILTSRKIGKNTILYTRFYTKYYNRYEKRIEALYFKRKTVFDNIVHTVYRKTPSEKYYHYLCTMDNDYGFIDFNVSNREYYQYLVVIQDTLNNKYEIYETRTDDGQSIYIKTDWNRWSITNIVETEEEGIYTQDGDVWLLGMNLESEDITQNLSVTSYDTLGQFPKISRAQKDYMSSSYTGLLGNVVPFYLIQNDGSYDLDTPQREYSEQNYDTIARYGEKVFVERKYSRELDKFNAWREFCSDGELKLLKDIKGNCWVVQIVDNPTRKLETKSFGVHTTISFNWKEVDNSDNITIINMMEESDVE